MATGVEPGTSTIAAALNGIIGSTTLTVIKNAREKPASATQTVVHDDNDVVVNNSLINRGVHPGVQVTGAGPVPTGSVTVQWFGNGTCGGRAVLASTTVARTRPRARLARPSRCGPSSMRQLLRVFMTPRIRW